MLKLFNIYSLFTCSAAITFFQSSSINQIKAHLQTYPNICCLFASTVRLFSVGILFSCNIILLLIFIYSLRESFTSLASGISSCCCAIILSEALLFVAYFWGGLHLSLSSCTEGLVVPSTRALILIITLILATASISNGYSQCLRDKGILSTSIQLVTLSIGILFTALQAVEFLLLEFGLNDSVQSSVFLFLTGLHFSHVVVGLIIINLCFWSSICIYRNTTSINGYSSNFTVLFMQLDYFSLLYWHFVEVLWLFIQFVLYTE